MSQPYRYGASHRAMRRHLIANLIDGETRCVRCRRPLTKAMKLHLDHTDDRRGYLGLAHAFCNESAAGRKGRRVQVAAARRAKLVRQSRNW